MAEVLTAALAIAAKDISIELRTKTAFMSALVFAILVLAILFFARDPTAVAAIDVAPGALWVTFTFAAMVGLNRSFLLERENRALEGILLSPIPRSSIFLGKLIGNLAFVFTIELISLPIFMLFYDVAIWSGLPRLLIVMVMTSVAGSTYIPTQDAVMARSWISDPFAAGPMRTAPDCPMPRISTSLGQLPHRRAPRLSSCTGPG